MRRNAPYRGDTDGLTTALRRELPEGRYLGLELELNQALLAEAGSRRRLTALLTRTLAGALAQSRAIGHDDPPDGRPRAMLRPGTRTARTP